MPTRGLPLPARLSRKLRKAADLDKSQWVELCQAAYALLKARILLARLLPRHLSDRLTDEAGKDESVADSATTERLEEIGSRIAMAAGNVPFRSDCLVQCLAADEILRREGFKPEFHLGVAKEPDGRLAAHAWVRCQGVAVVGGQGSGFEVLLGPREPVLRAAGEHPSMSE